MDRRELSIGIDRINAAPQGVEDEASWIRAVENSPWLTREYLHDLHRLQPLTSVVGSTFLSGNEQSWPSMIAYMMEIAKDPDAQKIRSRMVEGRIAIHDMPRHSDLEQRELARQPTLFQWHRPLRRMATHVVVSGEVLTRFQIQQMSKVLDEAIVTIEDEGLFGFLTHGMVRNVTTKIQGILTRNTDSGGSSLQEEN